MTAHRRVCNVWLNEHSTTRYNQGAAIGGSSEESTQELGKPENLANAKAGRQQSAAVRTAKADQWAQDLEEVIRGLQADGASTLQELADGLTAGGWPTPRGSSVWSRAQVQRLLARLA